MRDVYGAVADPTRRRLLDRLARAGELPLHRLADGIPMGRTAVAKHLAVLQEAGLVSGRRAGRETLYSLNAEPLRAIGDWVGFYQRFWRQRVDHLQRLLEEDGENG